MSGLWGFVRHPNYLGDIIMGLAWSLPCGKCSDSVHRSDEIKLSYQSVLTQFHHFIPDFSIRIQPFDPVLLPDLLDRPAGAP